MQRYVFSHCASRIGKNEYNCIVLKWLFPVCLILLLDKIYWYRGWCIPMVGGYHWMDDDLDCCRFYHWWSRLGYFHNVNRDTRWGTHVFIREPLWLQKFTYNQNDIRMSGCACVQAVQDVCFSLHTDRFWCRLSIAKSNDPVQVAYTLVD